jgi:hypothetical protein
MLEIGGFKVQANGRILIYSTPSGRNNGIYKAMIQRMSVREIRESIDNCLYGTGDSMIYGILTEVIYRIHNNADKILVIKGVSPHIESSKYKNKITKQLLELN